MVIDGVLAEREHLAGKPGPLPGRCSSPRSRTRRGGGVLRTRSPACKQGGRTFAWSSTGSVGRRAPCKADGHRRRPGRSGRRAPCDGAHVVIGDLSELPVIVKTRVWRACGNADRLAGIACCDAAGARFAGEGMPTPRPRSPLLAPADCATGRTPDGTHRSGPPDVGGRSLGGPRRSSPALRCGSGRRRLGTII